MTRLTYLTAYIVAHMQNSNNEHLKRAIRNRLLDRRLYRNFWADESWQVFEQTCAEHGPRAALAWEAMSTDPHDCIPQ